MVSMPMAPGAASANGKRLVSTSWGLWSDITTSIRPDRQRFYQRLAIVLGAQRRRQLAEGAVGADVVLIQREVVDRGRGRYRQARVLGAPQHVERIRAGQRGGVIAPLRQRDEAQVAFQHNGLGRP